LKSYNFNHKSKEEAGRFSDSLLAGWSGDRIPVWRRDFPHPSRPALGPTQPPAQRIPGVCHGYEAVGAWPWPLTFI